MRADRVIAVDLGGTQIRAGLVDAGGRVVRRAVRPTPVTSQPELVAALEAAIEEVQGEAAAVGVGVPSTIDQERGLAVSSVNVPLAGLDLRAHLRERFRLPAAIENDANAAALAEHRFGAGRGTRHMLMLTLGTGIGGGLILDGQLYRGAVGAAAELGHITIDIDGPPCQGTCPGLGHLEALASGTAAARLAREVAAARPDGDLGKLLASGRDPDARLTAALAAAGPGDARDVLERIGRNLGAGLAGYVNVFNPEVVVLGGGFARAGEWLFEPARRVVAERALAPARDLVRIVPASLGTDAGLVGSALAAFEAAA